MRTLLPRFRSASSRRRPAALTRLRPALEILDSRCLLDGAMGYVQTNLVSDIPGLADSTDPNLHNPWGMVASPSGSPFWVSDDGTGVSTLYNGAGQPFPVASPLVVNIPSGSATPAGSTGTPTGIVFNGNNTEFVVSQGGHSGASAFIFATLDGTISGWSPQVSFTNAIKVVDNSASGASYTGLALANNGSGDFLYAANFASGKIDVFNSQFQPTTLAGSFTDPNLPSGYAPYGIALVGGKLDVTYAPQNHSAGGLVDVFDVNGNFLQRLITGGNLDMPWGLAVAPSDFGQFSDALLVGNVAGGNINAYDPNTGAFRGQLDGTSGNPIAIPGLWSLNFGNNGNAGSSGTLFFSAGINHYRDGLIGSLTVPEQAIPSQPISEPIIPNLPASPTLFVSTVPSNGDQNPYGVAFVPPQFPTGGVLNPGDILVSNFNDSNNLQGTGSTIVRITPNGQQSVFFQGPSGIGLTTALAVLESGFVLVGNVPTTDGTVGTIQQGSLMILDRNGNVVENLTSSALLDGPWDMTVNDQGIFSQVFVSNVLSGTVTRIDLVTPPGVSAPVVASMTQIASGYAHFPNASALVVGPTGLAFDPTRNILYVASTGDNEIFAIPNAAYRLTDDGMGSLVYQDNAHLRGPLGLVLAPNGDLITANGDAVNADPKDPSELVEFTPAGQFVAQFSLSPEEGAAFGIALQFAGPEVQFGAPELEVRFAAVDDALNALHVWNIELDGTADSELSMAVTRSESSAAVAVKGPSVGSLTRGRTESHGHAMENLAASRLAPAMPVRTLARQARTRRL